MAKAMYLFKRCIEIFSRQEKERLGKAAYPVIYLSDLVAKTENEQGDLPRLVKVGSGFFQICEAALGGPESTIRNMIESAAKTSLAQICEMGRGYVIVVGPNMTLEDGKKALSFKAESGLVAAANYKNMMEEKRRPAVPSPVQSSAFGAPTA